MSKTEFEHKFKVGQTVHVKKENGWFVRGSITSLEYSNRWGKRVYYWVRRGGDEFYVKEEDVYRTEEDEKTDIFTAYFIGGFCILIVLLFALAGYMDGFYDR